VDRFAAYYTPAVLAIAVAVALVPPLFMAADWLSWIYRALVLLVVACPCALVISTPVTVVPGLTAAARRGILIKGGLFLEGGDKLNVLALDKTGTLTLGKPAVTDVIPVNGFGQAQLVSLTAALSSRSDHPVSMAIASHGKEAMSGNPVSGFNALRGRGVEGIIDGVQYRLGNHRLVKESGASTADLEQRLKALEQERPRVIISSGSPQQRLQCATTDSSLSG
jgi:Zn2+/Cd2+-exporting ATPase